MMNNILGRLREIATAVMYAAEASGIERVLERIADASRELAQTRYAALGIPDGKGGLRYFKTSGMSAEQIKLMDHLPLGHGLIGAPLRERHPIRLEKMSEDPRSVGFPPNHPEMNTFLGVPIVFGERLYGVLYLTEKLDGSTFNDDDQLLVETLAGYAAVAIAGVELGQQQNRLNLLEERERIGMELHDGIIQSLYAIGMQLELTRLTGDMPDDTLKPVIGDLDQVIEDIRSYILELRSRGEIQTTLYDAIRKTLERLHMPENLRVALDVPAEIPVFPPAMYESVMLIIHEAISNVVRHSDAQKVRVEAYTSNNRWQIHIQDDGQGFDVEQTLSQSNGLGLRNMQYRARLYGGDVEIDSQPGAGTHITIRIPTRT